MAEAFAKAGQGSESSWLAAKADRLQSEIALERIRAKMPAPAGGGKAAADPDGAAALAEKQLAIKRAMVKVAEARKKVAMAQLMSLKAECAQAQAAESFAEKQLKRFEELVRQNAIANDLVDERRVLCEAAKARRKAAEGKIAETEALVALEQARVAQAQLEAEEAELRLKQARSRLESQR
jgi:hypothetical protein